ncbi:MAG TPA: DUF420 domain-containing protein [Candidatus Thermoplasmatota archaeon]|nr:DUF420 domain-containing protein [Candidatus Thermoplasmatota archaeon]
MALFGTNAGLPTDILILGEIVITVLVYLGVRKIKKNDVNGHRTIMLTTLGLNAVLLVSFLITDIVKATNTIERGLTAPLWVFIPLLVVHLTIAITALTVAIVSWQIVRKGVVRDRDGHVLTVTGRVRAQHRRISRFYPNLWYSTLATGLILYVVLYLLY